MKKVKIYKILEDDIFKTPIVYLAIEGENKYIPVWIGPFEGESLMLGMKGAQLLRPLPYDTIINIINGLDAKIKHIIISQISNNTYYGNILIEKNSQSLLNIDIRPSDALNIAVRAGVDIFVEDRVIAKMAETFSGLRKRIAEKGIPDISEIANETKSASSKEKIRQEIDELKPGDF